MPGDVGVVVFLFFEEGVVIVVAGRNVVVVVVEDDLLVVDRGFLGLRRLIETDDVGIARRRRIRFGDYGFLDFGWCSALARRDDDGGVT